MYSFGEIKDMDKFAFLIGGGRMYRGKNQGQYI